MIYRTYDVGLLNYIANQPGVYAFVTAGLKGDPRTGEPVFLDNCAAQPDDYVLLTNGVDGGMVFEWSAAGIWEMHTMFLPSCRGKRALDDAKAMVRFMFEDMDAFALWGQTPLSDKMRHARWFNRKLGGKVVGEKEHWLFGPCQLFRCTKAEWEAAHR